MAFARFLVRMTAVAAAFVACVAAGSIAEEALPDRAPMPGPRDPGEASTPDGLPEKANTLPASRPTEGKIVPPEDMPKAGRDALPDATVAVPAKRPVDGKLVPPGPDVPVSAPPAELTRRDRVVPAEEMACRARLETLGVDFEVEPAAEDGGGCDMPFPLKISALSKEIEVTPEIVVNCRTAEAAATFVRDRVAPLARAELGSDLTSIRQDSGYVCRPRNGTSTLSEHAFGNAIDIGAFRLADGRDIAVEKTSDGTIGRFLAKVRHAACGPFKTVLGPGSDADHATHFHFDMAERRGGSAYCR